MNSILIVDDEEGARSILQIAFQRAGYAVQTAANALEAQALVDDGHSFDLIILDDMMPGMSGSDWCMAMKASQHTRHVPILIYSAHSRVQAPGYAGQIGADGVLFKPRPLQEIIGSVQSFLVSNPR